MTTERKGLGLAFTRAAEEWRLVQNRYADLYNRKESTSIAASVIPSDTPGRRMGGPMGERYVIPAISALSSLFMAGCYMPEVPPAEEPVPEEPVPEEPVPEEPPEDDLPDPVVGDWDLVHTNYDGTLTRFPHEYVDDIGSILTTAGATFSVDGPNNIWLTFSYTYNDGSPPATQTYTYEVVVDERNIGSWSIIAYFYNYAFTATCTAEQDTLTCSNIMNGGSLSLAFTRAAEE